MSAAAARVKLAQGEPDLSAGSDDAQRRREEDKARAHEAQDLPLPAAALPADLAPPKQAAIDQAPAAPLAPAQIPDPDAAHLQKHGAGLGAASISIDHPELGEMDLVVQSENGRIEVRAVLETPQAAQVLRAHESALRYGIQQAGMTFGALRVRARTGDGGTIKARDNSKRRRDHEWEA
jgi:hypothetical protein